MSDHLHLVEVPIGQGVAVPIKVWIIDDGDVTTATITSARVEDGFLLLEVEADA